MVTDPRSKEHFCFDYGGDDGENLVLVDDAKSGKEVESHMIDFGTNTVHKNLNYFNKWCLQETHTMESTAITSVTNIHCYEILMQNVVSQSTGI